MKGKLIQLAREPLLQFLLIGACIYAANGLFGAPQEEADSNNIVVDQVRIKSFISQWQSRWNRPPTRQELDGLINAYVRENILYRQALAMGLDEDDPVTRRRMAQKLEFLTNDIALLKEPAAGELEQYFKDNEALFREPDRITFDLVYLDPDKREDATLADAATLLAQLREAGTVDASNLELGDRLMVPNVFQRASQRDIQRQLGSGFAESVMSLEPGQWHGPVLSGYGVHLVYVSEVYPAPAPIFADVREAALQSWQSKQQETFNKEFYAGLKARYKVVIEEPPAGAIFEARPAEKAAAATRGKVVAPKSGSAS